MARKTHTPSPAPQVANRHDLIRVQGARVNNLKDVSVEIPKRRLTVFMEAVTSSVGSVRNREAPSPSRTYTRSTGNNFSRRTRQWLKISNSLFTRQRICKERKLSLANS